MAKVYTAQEMREMADAIAGDMNESCHTSVKYTFDDLIPVIESLRQAADDLEREEKREKRYEYAAKYLSVDDETDVISKTHFESAVQATETAVKVHCIRHVVIRREVGEWEEVRDGE